MVTNHGLPGPHGLQSLDPNYHGDGINQML